jgi:hypothetical protein
LIKYILQKKGKELKLSELLPGTRCGATIQNTDTSLHLQSYPVAWGPELALQCAGIVRQQMHIIKVVDEKCRGP